ncbi:hypothetical protein ACN3XK_08190 [Actinomadura welshii]
MVERPEPGQPTPAPPPPQWLDDKQPQATPLLPGEDADQDEPEDPASETGAAETGAAETGAPEGDAEAEAAGGTVGDRTVTDFSLDESSHTVVMPSRAAAAGTAGSQQDDSQQDDSQKDAGEEARQDVGQPAPPSPMATSTDIPAPPPFPYTQQGPDDAQAQPPAPPPLPYGRESADVTRAEPFPHQSPMPPPPPAHSQPGMPNAGPPAPPASPSQSPPAHEPFPYAQEIPGSPAASPREPFPYAQEIPGVPSTPPAAEPFPWAQQIPGAPQPPGQGVAGPVAPPPVINEPWRTGSPGNKSRGPRKSIKKPLLIGVAGLAVAALAAAGVVFVPGLLDDGGGDGETGAKLAGSIFPLNDAARTDGRNQEFTGAAAVDTTVVAVGGESGVDRSRGLFLVSTDGGRTFEPAEVRSSDDGSASTTAPQVVGGSSAGWIAIASGGTGAVWTSPDGRTWTQQPDAVGRVFGRGKRVHQVVSTGNGFVAIGASSAKGDFSDAEAAVWSSPDGRQWETRVGDQIGLEVNRASYSLIEVAASGDTLLLKALVKPDNKKPPQYRKVWRSQDGGQTWAVSEVPVPKGARGLTVGGGEAGFLAIREMGKNDEAHGRAFVSRDGKSWSEAGELELDGYGHTMQILGGAKGYTALVRHGGDVLLAHSADGRTWKPAGSVPGMPGRQISGGALAEGHTTLVGHNPGGGDMDPLLSVWDTAGQQIPLDAAKIPGVVQPDHAVQAVGASGSLAVAVGSASGDAAVWKSADGASWEAAQGLGAAFTRPGSQRLLDVTGGQAGWVAVGYDQIAPKRPLVVVSKDGATWQTADSAAPFGTGKKQNLATNATASGSGGYVVVGSEGPSAAAWFSADLKDWERGSGGDPDALKGEKDAGRWMLDVADGGSGFTAVGGVSDAKGDRPAVWSSSDGRQWALKTLPLPSGVREGHLTHVAAKGGTLVAAGVATAEQGPIWIGYVSKDSGASWQELPVPGGDEELAVTALTATPEGFAATAASGGTANSADVVSMTTSDGSNWAVSKPQGAGLSGEGAQTVTGLAAFREKVLGVGRTVSGSGEEPVLWSRPLS